ncbi:MAG: pyridoxamine 5'-phosphate oxidase family protein [FCB group bacterium]|nr:pyridoxamine 5'-phosphate oxidase family protein [FCB group bacterium]
MRRTEHKCGDITEFETISSSADVGYLGLLTTDGYPRVIPVNFATEGETVYFHGAIEGEKYDLLKESPKVTFSMNLVYSYIPSYWTSKKSAGTATMFYKSALIKGRGSIVTDEQEKAFALNLLMKKHQPEGGYQPITADDPLYEHIFKATAIFRIDADQIDIKINFRKKKSREYNLGLIKNLENRGMGRDLATAAEIRKILED